MTYLSHGLHNILTTFFPSEFTQGCLDTHPSLA